MYHIKNLPWLHTEAPHAYLNMQSVKMLMPSDPLEVAQM